MGEGTPQAVGGRHYGVKLVRGPFVRLAAHADECADAHAFLSYATRLRAEGAHLAADLFSGAGGLSLGLEAAGYRVVLSVDRDPEAFEMVATEVVAEAHVTWLVRFCVDLSE